jgi:hypothetical protein
LAALRFILFFKSTLRGRKTASFFRLNRFRFSRRYYGGVFYDMWQVNAFIKFISVAALRSKLVTRFIPDIQHAILNRNYKKNTQKFKKIQI